MSDIAALITYCNEGPKLSRCLQSMLAQHPPLAEILIHDDASSLRPEPFLPQDPRIRVLRSAQNVGPARGRNLLLAASRARYLHWHDADDWLLPGWSAAMTAAFASGAELVYCQMRAVDNAGAPLTDAVLQLDALRRADDPVVVALRHSLMVSSMALDRALLERSGPWPEQYTQSEDYAFHLALLRAVPRLALLDRPLVMVDWGTHNRSNDREQVYADAFRVVADLVSQQPKYRGHAAEVLAEQSAWLYRNGYRARAAAGVQLARRLGPPRFVFFPPTYRTLARCLGQRAVEWLAACYRRLLPGRWRALLRRRGNS